MYENELAMTGLGAVVLGPIVFGAWWMGALFLVVGGTLLFVVRRVHRRKAQ
ncbi:hypothetical protein [Oerskovia jenensis]|uniref:hypothetical protein n=1 Tax=Oerskovia jenensis TaxID=162169 RepID=UPI0036DDC5B5